MPASASYVELVTNGDFSNGLNGWSTYNVNVGEAAPSPRVFVTDGGFFTQGLIIQGGVVTDVSGVEQTFDITGYGPTFTLSVDYSTNQNFGTGFVDVYWYDGATFLGAYHDLTIQNVNSGDIVNYTVNLTRGALQPGKSTVVPEGATHAKIGLYNYASGFQIAYDNVSLQGELVPEPASAMLLAGAAMVLLRRRVA